MTKPERTTLLYAVRVAFYISKRHVVKSRVAVYELMIAGRRGRQSVACWYARAAFKTL